MRARYNLAWVPTREHAFPTALQRIAEALALDKTGDYRVGPQKGARPGEPPVDVQAVQAFACDFAAQYRGK